MGKYEDWPTYQDLFLALVHNTSLSNVQKLHYLKTSVSGEAEILLRNIQITDSNYNLAWDLLKARFGNKKMITNYLLKRLFNQRRVSMQSANQIKLLLDTTSECINSLHNLKITTDSWDPMIVFLVSQKLDLDSLKDWEEYSQKQNRDELCTWEEMKGFLETKFRTLELVTPNSNYSREKPQTKTFHITTNDEEGSLYQSAHMNLNSQPSCTYCKGGHYIFHCKEYGKQSVEQRRDFARKNNLCYNCLVPNHNVYTCKQKTSCQLCSRKHHSLLHEVRKINKEKEPPQPEQKITTAHFSKSQPGQEVLLATAQVKVRSSNGETHILRVLIDQGSEATFVSARAVELLGLKRTNINGLVSGVGEGNQVPIKHLVELTVSPCFNNNEGIRVRAYVLKKISTRLPSKHIIMNCQQLQMLELADATYSTPGKIDMLLGSDVYCKIIQDGLVKLPDGIVAQKTSLGWILSGQRDIDNSTTNRHDVITLHITGVVAEDNDMLRKFWEIETELYKRRKLVTKEEERCEEIFNTTTTRDETGRYKVYLPLKQSIEETINLCGDTKQQAVERFKQLERKFQRNYKLRMEYTRVIQEYKEMGHMRPCDTLDDNNAIYLPHHAVIREDKDSSQVRVVFDASAKGSHGSSLNQAMMVGPVLQPDLRSLIISWRKHKICVVADIVKMYRMIRIAKEHTNLQRIVWRDTPDHELEINNLMTVTFGTAAALFLAVRTLNQLADDEAHEFPNTASVIKRSFYMDDLMTGHDDIESTKKMCEEIRTVLQRGGFKMQKWSSNSEEVLQHLQGENRMKDTIEIKLDKIIKILGLTWDRKDDAFKVTVNLPELRVPITKRSILSDVARLFDPFGWLSPVVVTAKILIQQLWLSKLDWDTELDSTLSNEWVTYREELSHLQTIQVPRWFNTMSITGENVEIHGFADSSTKNYAAVTYLRVIDDNTIHIQLIASRTKVAPLKQLSVPKLELCAAALLTELLNDLMETLDIPQERVFAWTDSMVVLSWLQSQPSRWRTFVANRVADITRVINNNHWRHVQSADNPADIATRSIKACDLASQETWWTGPAWLRNKNMKYDNSDIPQTDLEMKVNHKYATLEETPIWERFSTMSRMKRVLAYCRRFMKNGNTEKREKYLTTGEMEKILEQCIKYYQNLNYEREVEDLKKDGKVKMRSHIIALAPYLDNNGVMRVGGRLQNASIAESTKHPIIIPSNQHITKLIVNEAHTKTLHGGIQLMMSYIRTKYWVIGLKSAVRKCIHKCKICIISNAKVKTQFMGQLPAIRVNQHRAFINCGADFAGPISIRSAKGRGHHATKGYICLFVCMATRAIHMEAVMGLTSQAFIAAFRRLCAPRGRCLNLYCDNGTNFVGAEKELKELFQKNKNNVAKEVAELLANDGTTWHFIPPRMPNCGGLSEAGIRSAKRHLMRVNKDTKLTYEELATLLAQIEACLNSRPLCKIDDTSDTPLTSGHFLVGESLISVPDLKYDTMKLSHLTRWQFIQCMMQDFWHRWQTEYLNTMQQRYKWQKKIASPAMGDLVVIKDEMLPPTKWLLGRISHLHFGTDQLARVAVVRTAKGTEYKRPLSKLIPLPTDIDE